LVFFIYRKQYVGIITFILLAYFCPHETYQSLSPFRLSLTISLIILVCWFIQRNNSERPVIFNTQFKCLLAISVIVLISSIFALYPQIAFEGFIKIFKMTILYFLIINIVNSENKIKFIFFSILLGSIYLSLKGYQFYKLGRTVDLINRGIFGEKNHIALALNMAIPICWSLIEMQNTSIKKALYTPILFILIFGIFLTKSRGGFIVLGFLTIPMVLLSKKKIFQILLITLVLIPVITWQPKNYWNWIETIKTYEADGSAMGRIYGIKVGISMMKKKPLLGVGQDHFQILYSDYAPPDVLLALNPEGENRESYMVAHNNYAQYGGENGLIALGLYLLVMFMTLKDLWKIRKVTIPKDEGLQMLYCFANGILLSLLAFAVGSSALSLTNFDLYYIMLGLGAALCIIVNEKKKIEQT